MKKVTLCTLLLFGILALPFPILAAEPASIARGIYIQGIDVGGMTRDDAILAINEHFEEFTQSSYQIQCADGTTTTVKLEDWDLKWNAESTVDQVLSYSIGGSLIRRYKTEQNLTRCGLYVQVPFTTSQKKIRSTIKKQVVPHDTTPRNATLTRNGSTFSITALEQDGTVTDVDRTTLLILDSISDAISSDNPYLLTTPVAADYISPKVTSEQLSVITDELGSFTTDYADSDKNRKTNISVACSYIDGTVLQPGEKLSADTLLHPRTEEFGYMEAAAYSNGETEKEIGGGVCQVTTTLYNAALRAELQIDERHNHSMVVHYVDYGADAAIASSRKDLVIKNNLKNPIYIEAKATGKKLTISIYGTETRPANRKVEYLCETVSEEYPAKDDYNIKETDELPTGTEKITGTRRPAVRARLYKIVTVDGQETERTLLHVDSYKASKKTKLIGTGPAPEKKSKKKK